MRVLLLLLLVLMGCNTVEIQTIRKDKKIFVVSEILEQQFTSEALSALHNIKIYEGFHFHSYVTGVNIWSNIASFITFNGVGRKVISSQGTMADSDPISSIVHEYTHQLDDLDRDRVIEIIDHSEFWNAFLLMRREPSLREATDTILDHADRWITNIFGIGPTSEIIAYTASWVVRNPEECPFPMHQALSRILKVSAFKVSEITSRNDTLH